MGPWHGWRAAAIRGRVADLEAEGGREGPVAVPAAAAPMAMVHRMPPGWRCSATHPAPNPRAPGWDHGVVTPGVYGKAWWGVDLPPTPHGVSGIPMQPWGAQRESVNDWPVAHEVRPDGQALWEANREGVVPLQKPHRGTGGGRLVAPVLGAVGLQWGGGRSPGITRLAKGFDDGSAYVIRGGYACRRTEKP